MAMSAYGSPLNLPRWLSDHAHLLRPPIGNAQFWQSRDVWVSVATWHQAYAQAGHP